MPGTLSCTRPYADGCIPRDLRIRAGAAEHGDKLHGRGRRSTGAIDHEHQRDARALGESLLVQGRIAEAEPLLVSSVKQLGGSLHYDRRLAVQRLIRLYELKGDLVSARQWKDELATFARMARAQ